MKTALAVRTFLAVAVFAFVSNHGAVAADDPAFDQYKNIVDLQFMKENAVIPVKDGVLVIDARPSRKYDEGHIPGAINIPDTFFDKMSGKLPEDKSSLLIFYCGGVKCPLSHKSAVKAEDLGYTNIQVFAAGEPAWTQDGNLISVGAKYVKAALAAGTATVIDARPTRTVKSTGIIPAAINIPDTFFDKMTDKLPQDKSAELIFYCGGYKCPLSPKSAAKAKDLGYTNVKVYQAGYPDWTETFGAGEQVAQAEGGAAKTTAPAAVLKAGPSGDAVDVESLRAVLAEAPDSIYVVDVRDASEFEAGSIPGAINIPVDEMMDRVAELPEDKPIVFVCATGARSGEAYDIVLMERDDLKVYFLDAEVTYAGGGYEIKAMM